MLDPSLRFFGNAPSPPVDTLQEPNMAMENGEIPCKWKFIAGIIIELNGGIFQPCLAGNLSVGQFVFRARRVSVSA